jgi:hypothetical protein
MASSTGWHAVAGMAATNSKTGLRVMEQEQFNESNGEGDDPQATSSMENIIPVKQISHGWRVLQGFAMVDSPDSLQTFHS